MTRGRKTRKKMKNPFALVSSTRKILASTQKTHGQPLILDLENPKTTFLEAIKPTSLPHLSQQTFFFSYTKYPSTTIDSSNFTSSPTTKVANLNLNSVSVTNLKHSKIYTSSSQWPASANNTVNGRNPLLSHANLHIGPPGTPPAVFFLWLGRSSHFPPFIFIFFLLLIKACRTWINSRSASFA